MFFIFHQVDANRGLRIGDGQPFLHPLDQLPDRRLVFQKFASQAGLIHERAQQAGALFFAAQSSQQTFEIDHVLQDGVERLPADERAMTVHVDFDGLSCQLGKVVVQGLFVFEIVFGFTFFHLKERGLRDVDITSIDQFMHLAKQEREEERSDVAAIDVRIRHQDDFVVPGTVQIEGFLVILAFFRVIPLGSDPRPQGHDERANFFARQHLVEPRFFDVEDLPFQRKDGLKLSIAALLRRPAG